jgi:hypothetical protein
MWGNQHVINFKFAECPSCNTWIEPITGNLYMKNTLDGYKKLQVKVKEKCLLRAQHEGLDKEERVTDPKSEYYNDLAKFAYD